MKIVELKPSQRVKGRFLVRFDDDTLLRVTEAEVIAFSLHCGKEMSVEQAQQLEEQGQLGAIRNKAFQLIGRKPVSRFDLAKKLREWDATEEEVEEICTYFEELALINDAHYAKLLAGSCYRKGYGESRLKQEFYKHGIHRDLWEEATEDYADHSEAIDKFIRQKLKGERPDKKQGKKVTDGLARRGFSWDEIHSGMRRYEEELEESFLPLE